MKWFEGDITAAVEKSKSKKAVFVVFVEGKDDVSKALAETLNATEVSLQLESEKFVAIKIQSDSNTYGLFAEIYKVVPIPSIFFIGENGRPVKIISSALSPSDLVSKIDSILVKSSPEAQQPSTNSVDVEQKAHSSNSDNTNTNSISGISQPSENLSTDQQTNNSESITKEPETIMTKEETIDKNKELQRAKLIIEMQNKKRIEEEEKKEREREIERRKMGKDAQKWRRQQHDRQYLEAHEERMKDKAADAAAREKILQQIAEDKLERKRKFEMSMQEKNNKKQNTTQEVQSAAPATGCNTARIQFKTPTGKLLTGTFDASSTLESLRTYVIQNANLPFQDFSMSSFFPRRNFTSADNEKTLAELELVPSSVILILPIKSSNHGTVKKSDDGGNIFSFFFWTLLAPVISVYNYVMGYFRGRPAGGGNDNENESRNPGSTRLGTMNIDFSQFTNLRARRISTPRTSKIKSRGNIHTLHSGDNDNDENNTWNGNSTQQM